MEWLIKIISTILIYVPGVLIILGFLFKNYILSYIQEKGKNLATKEDVEEITRKTEEVQKEFREGFEIFSSDVRFKYDFYYKRYSELYVSLYAVVMQSEYVRKFIVLTQEEEILFSDAPFLEVSRKKIETTKMNITPGEPVRTTRSFEEVETPLSKFNKEHLCNLIIDRGDLASQKLLKIAIAYRFAYHFYDGNGEKQKFEHSDVANEEELRLLLEMVQCIVSEYNELRKYLKMDFNESELETGIPTIEC